MRICTRPAQSQTQSRSHSNNHSGHIRQLVILFYGVVCCCRCQCCLSIATHATGVAKVIAGKHTHTHSYRKAGSYFSLNHRFNLPFTSTSTAEWCYVVPLPALAQDMTGYSVDLHLCRCVYVCSVQAHVPQTMPGIHRYGGQIPINACPYVYVCAPVCGGDRLMRYVGKNRSEECDVLKFFFSVCQCFDVALLLSTTVIQLGVGRNRARQSAPVVA